MFSESAEAIAQLQTLRAAFAAALPAKWADINALWQVVKQQSDGNSGEAIELYRAVHNLTGAAGAFGQHETGTIARQLENQLKQSLNPGSGPISPTHSQIIEAELQKLGQTIQSLDV